MGTSSDTGEPKNLDVSIEEVFTYLLRQKYKRVGRTRERNSEM